MLSSSFLLRFVLIRTYNDSGQQFDYVIVTLSTSSDRITTNGLIIQKNHVLPKQHKPNNNYVFR